MCVRIARVLAFGLLFGVSPFNLCADPARELRIGRASHAFDHLGNISGQAEAAAASGATILYASGLGSDGYLGLPSAEKLAQEKAAAADYVKRAKKAGIRLALGYICATSIVKLETFDREWTPTFRAQFHSPPSEWRQQGRDGKFLPSWYGGAYQPACMNHPDWRTYEKFIVRQQIECGHDGIFFDNPTVHPKGCYCRYCMEQFARFLERESAPPADRSVAGLRRTADERPDDFRRFRCTIARDFIGEMRAYARSLKRDALVTCNNSLNSPEAFYSQNRSYAYNIHELSKAEDFVVVEDMGHQPRLFANGNVFEYGPVYKLIHALAHGKPVVAVTLAEADYHTPARLARLAMAEAAANSASYLSWPTWPETVRPAMIAGLRPQADLLRHQERFLNDAPLRRDVVLFLPFRRWLDTERCAALEIAAALSRANVQFEAVCEDDFDSAHLKRAGVLLLESRSVLNSREQAIADQFERAGRRVVAVDRTSDWLQVIKRDSRLSVNIQVGGAPGVQNLEASAAPKAATTPPPEGTVRVVVRDQSNRTIIHVLNLGIERLSSFEDKLYPVENARLECRVPFSRVHSVRALTADEGATSGAVRFAVRPAGKQTVVTIDLPRLEIATMLVME